MEGRPYRTSRSLEEILSEVPTETPEEIDLTPTEVAKKAVYDQIQGDRPRPHNHSTSYTNNFPKHGRLVAQLREIVRDHHRRQINGRRLLV